MAIDFDLLLKNHIFLIGITLAGLLGILGLRAHEARRRVTARSIVIPPLGMSTGFLMFAHPAFRLPWTWGLGALAAGALILAYPLQRSSRLLVEGGQIIVQRSRAFLLILVALAGARLALREYLDLILPVKQTGALFFLLAFGMIARWRIGMLMEYRRLAATLAASLTGVDVL